VPGYISLLVHYDLLRLEGGQALRAVQELAGRAAALALPEPRRVKVPVHYGGEHGPDLEFVARQAGLSPAEVVRIHTGAEYPVYFIGFTPGFPYLGGLDPRLFCPRLETPRARVPAGSVGIAGQQTGIYSVDSPGGWRLIGWTPLKLFDPLPDPPSLLAPGDVVRFSIADF
jgi:inhibitor of KinA